MDLFILEAFRRALDDAGLLAQPFPHERTALILGASEMGLDPRIEMPLAMHVDDAVRAVAETPGLRALPPSVVGQLLADLTRCYQELSARNISSGTVSGTASIALGRICALYDLKGPHYAVDAGCASGLSAIEKGVQALSLGICDIAVVGNSSPFLSPRHFVTHHLYGTLDDRQEAPRPFAEDANGSLLGEGVSVLVLKRLVDAMEDGSRIHGVIRGVSGASEGKRAAAPVRAQILAARRCYAQAGYGPEAVQYLECHANGVPGWDSAEIEAMAEVFGRRPVRSLVIGSVKHGIGYLASGSAMASVIRVLMALRHKEYPGHPCLRRVRAELQAQDTPFRVLLDSQEWPEAGGDVPRRASVNSLGIGGVAYHLTLEQFVPDYHASLVDRRTNCEPPGPVAIVSVGAIMPGAGNSEEFWQNMREGKDQVTAVPPDRFDIERYYDPAGGPGKTYCTLGGFVRDFRFDWRTARLPPSLVQQYDRTHLYALTAAVEAVQRVGSWQTVRERTAVFLADMPRRTREHEVDCLVMYAEFAEVLRQTLSATGCSPQLAEAIADAAEQNFKKRYAPLSEDTLAGINSGMVSALVAQVCGFCGPSGTFESTCSSSLAALEAAVAALQLGESDLVLAGGTFANLTAGYYSLNCSFGGLSPTGIRPFDAGANGFVPGEGAGVLVLKRLSDAERDGDPIVAVIRGIGSSSDGKGKSLLAPNPVGQELAVRRSLERAGIAPSTIQYIECHGTGTPVGDFSELTSYGNVFRGRQPGSVAIGSVKSMIGHLASAAGVASVIKVALSLRNQVLAPSLHFGQPSTSIPWDELPFRVVTGLEPWPEAACGFRRAGVSSFGLGGTNYHVVLEEYRRQQRAPDIDPTRFPMIESLREWTADRVVAIRHLSLETDLYLAEHCLNGVPLLPGTFGIELMGETALCSFPGWHLMQYRGIRFHQGVKVWQGRRTRLVTDAQIRRKGTDRALADVRVHCERQPKADQPPVQTLHYEGTAVLMQEPLVARYATPGLRQRLYEGKISDHRASYNAEANFLSLGQMIQNCPWFSFISDTETGACAINASGDQLFTFTRGPCFIHPPLLMDAYLHPAGAIAHYNHTWALVPASCEELTLFGSPPQGNNILVHASYRGLTSGGLLATDIIAFDEETLQIYADIRGFCFRPVYEIGPKYRAVLDGSHASGGTT